MNANLEIDQSFQLYSSLQDDVNLSTVITFFGGQYKLRPRDIIIAEENFPAALLVYYHHVQILSSSNISACKGQKAENKPLIS